LKSTQKEKTGNLKSIIILGNNIGLVRNFHILTIDGG
jgi:hypothetical protein